VPDCFRRFTKRPWSSFAFPGSSATVKSAVRTELYYDEEPFLCGSGYLILPIISIDLLPVGDGEVGPLTSKVAATFVAVARSTVPDRGEWRTAVYAGENSGS
jgi:branched-chain amino acid aminotransferase